MTPVAPLICTITLDLGNGVTLPIRYFLRDSVVYASLRDVLRVSEIDRNTITGRSFVAALAPSTSQIKFGRNDADVVPLLELLERAREHSISGSARVAIRHLLHLVKQYQPGTPLPLKTTVPQAVAVNPNTFHPETSAELLADPAIKPDSVPKDPENPSTSRKRHRADQHTEAHWYVFSLVPSAALLPPALVEYHRARCGTDFDRFLWTLRTEVAAEATLNRERAQTAVAEEQLRQLRRSRQDEDGEIGEGCPLVQRMTSLLLHALPKGSLSLPCHTPSCNSRISAFSFGVSGATPHTLVLCCTDCAEGSEAPLVRVRTMDRVRALTWLCHVGPTLECVCAVCEDVDTPIGILQDGWHLAHRRARAHGGKREPANLVVAHGCCNLEQGTRSLAEVREAAGMDEYVPHMTLQEAKQSLRRYLY